MSEINIYNPDLLKLSNMETILRPSMIMRMRYITSLILFLLIAGFGTVVQAQTVTVFTDKDDYYPGEWVIITGSGWQNDDSVKLTLTHIEPNIPNHDHEIWYVLPDQGGNIYDEWFVLDQELGTTFMLEALGVPTDNYAVTYFTDGNDRFYVSGLPSGITVTLTDIEYTKTNGSLENQDIPFLSGSYAQIGAKQNTQVFFKYPELITTGLNSYNFISSDEVSPYTSTKDAKYITGVYKTAQTITFNALVEKTYGEAAFLVSATASSGLPVSFSIVSGPATISGNLVSINGAGLVTIRASQAGNATYDAATSVDQSFTVNQKAASVTPNPGSKLYGSSDPTLTGTLEGFIASDNVTATYARTSGEDVSGSPYTISATLNPSVDLNNYDITYKTERLYDHSDADHSNCRCRPDEGIRFNGSCFCLYFFTNRYTGQWRNGIVYWIAGPRIR